MKLLVSSELGHYLSPAQVTQAATTAEGPTGTGANPSPQRWVKKPRQEAVPAEAEPNSPLSAAQVTLSLMWNKEFLSSPGENVPPLPHSAAKNIQKEEARGAHGDPLSPP